MLAIGMVYPYLTSVNAYTYVYNLVLFYFVVMYTTLLVNFINSKNNE